MLLVFLQLLQAFYTFIIGQLAIPQWINPLRPSDPPDFFSAAFILKFGGQQSDTSPSILLAVAFAVLFPFIGVYIMHCICSLIEETRDLSVWQLDIFVPQYLAEKFMPIKRFRPKKRREWATAKLVPKAPLQMPGPATNSLALSIACHPRPEEVGTGMSLKKVQWGVVREPQSLADHSTPEETGFELEFPEPVTSQPPRPGVSANFAGPADYSIGRISWPVVSPALDLERSAFEPTLTTDGTAVEPRDYHFHRPRHSISRKPVSAGAGNDYNDNLDNNSSFLYRPVSTDYTIGTISDEPEHHAPASGPLPPPQKRTKSDQEKVMISVSPIHPAPTDGSVSSCSATVGSEEHGADRYGVGHCAFSALPVSELQPDLPYTGIRRDGFRLGARGRATLLLASLLPPSGPLSRSRWMQSLLGRALIRWSFPEERRDRGVRGEANVEMGRV